jgi:outer membrane receptor protein involved in Fe transport
LVIAPVFAREGSDSQSYDTGGTVQSGAAENDAREAGEVSFHEEVVVIATATERDEFETPRALTIVSREELERENHLSVVDVLDGRVGVWVEKRTITTSDPVIRGLSGSNLLALIDGNTLSTLWGEGGYAGDDMYGKIDADSIERIEVIRGPQSVLYGSNALGGVLNFITKSCPLGFTKQGARWGVTLKPTFGSAAGESRFRHEIYGATPGFRFILGGSLRDADDVRRGGGDKQVPTSGRDKNWDFKGDFKLSPRQGLTVTYQDIRREKVHRFYRPTQDNFNDREAVGLFYAMKDLSPSFVLLKIKAYYQDKRDVRRFKDRGTIGVAKTRTYTSDVQATQKLGKAHRLTYGFHFHPDLGESADDEQFTIFTPDGAQLKASPDTTWDNFGLYVQDEWDVSNKMSLISSLRVDYFRFKAEPDEFYQPPGGWDPQDDAVREKKYSTVGGLGLLYRLTDHHNLVGNYSRGYRLWAPQFGATQRGYGVVVPSGLLDPVTGDTFEVGLKTRAKHFRSSVFGYYTKFRNWQIIVPGTFEGSDWYDFNQSSVEDAGESVYVTKDSGDAYVYGVELEGELSLEAFSSAMNGWHIGGGFAWNYGKDQNSGDPFRHTQPAEGKLYIKWDKTDIKFKPWVKLAGMFVGAFDRIPPDRLQNDVGYRVDPQDKSSPLVRDYGLPGYSVFDLRAGLKLWKQVNVTLNIENITDKLYRQAHSRWDEVGRNFVVGVSYGFTF